MAVVRRARALLGTLVEIRADADEERARGAIAAAFEAVASVQHLMSAHDPQSDVGRLNRLAHARAVRVDPRTWHVLRIARNVSARSGGAFDVCVAPQLARWGYLPAWVGRGAEASAGWEAIELLPGSQVRLRRRLALDLGGIAKGYAVDRAAAVLAARGIADFTVNAGGDLRVGRKPQVVHVRDPADPARLLALAEVSGAAAATSATYFAKKRWRGRRVHPIVVPGGEECATLEGRSVTVLAPQCAIADSLTKVVAVLGERSAPVLAHFGAEARVLAGGGKRG